MVLMSDEWCDERPYTYDDWRAERENVHPDFEGEGNEPDNDDPIQSIEFL